MGEEEGQTKEDGDISLYPQLLILCLVENIGMSHHPESAEENTHPSKHLGIQLQHPGAGGQAGAGEQDGHARAGGEGTVADAGGRGV